MKGILFLFLGCLTTLMATGQITTVPEFPTIDDVITINLDATKGNKGLEDCNCEIYIYTGLITENSSNGSDWRYVQGQWGVADPRLKMEKTSTNTYTIDINIREFYGVPMNEKVKEIAVLFHDDSGDNAARADDGGDLFIPLFEQTGALIMQLLQPDFSPVIVARGGVIPIQGKTNEDANLRLEVAGSVVYESATPSSELFYTYSANLDPGVYEMYFIANTDSLSFEFIVVPMAIVEPAPPGLIYGANRLANGQTTFLIHAPEKNYLFLLGDFTNWEVDLDFQMKQTPDGQDFWITVDGLNDGDWHTYQYLVDGKVQIADPYSEVVLDPWNDPFLPANTKAFFPTYPQDGEGIVTAFKFEGFPYNWQHDGFECPPNEDLFIYELLVRDFLESHSYEDLIDTLGYLKRLGVNAIELMPVNEFEGNISWGYNPSFHMALDKYYGDPITFKKFVDAAHGMGMAVIVDIVLNHAFSQSPLAQMYWDPANTRPAANNPYLNVEAKHPFNVGYDFNHESPSTKAFVQRIIQYWLAEFDIDGYRFDLSKGFTQRFSTENSNFAKLDESRVAIIEEMMDHALAINEDAILILEHFADNNEEKLLSEMGFLLWGNSNFNYNEATMGYHGGGKSDFSWAYYKQRGWDFPHVISYMESHDEERLQYKNINFGNSQSEYTTKQKDISLDRIALAHTFFWTIPGPKMMWQFGELGYDFSINYCEDGTINEFCRTGPKPVRWDYLEDQDRVSLYNHVSDMAWLKQTYPLAFSENNVTLNIRDAVKQIQSEGSGLSYVAVGNFDVVERQESISFPTTGVWYDYLSETTIQVSQTDMMLTLAPGAHHLWLNQAIDRPLDNDYTTGLNPEINDDNGRLLVYPNPGYDEVLLSFPQNINGQLKIELIDVSGKIVNQGTLDNVLKKERYPIHTAGLQSGLYILKVTSKNSFWSEVVMLR